MSQKSKKLFDEIQDEMAFRKYLPRQIKINKFLESLKRKVIDNYDIPISIKELNVEYEKSPIFENIYKYITKGHSPSQIKGHAFRKLKPECEDYLVIDDVLFRIEVLKDEKHRTFITFGNTRNLCSYTLIPISGFIACRTSRCY